MSTLHAQGQWDTTPNPCRAAPGTGGPFACTPEPRDTSTGISWCLELSEAWEGPAGDTTESGSGSTLPSQTFS